MPSAHSHAKPTLSQAYQLLQLTRSASVSEIKAAYKKLALRHHPDQPGGNQKDFVRLTAAYEQVLEHSSSGAGAGGSSRSHSYARRSKVYAPQAPPEWKWTWNHAEHYDMHYGRGLQKQALKSILRDEGHKLEYKSPLGRGFSFSTMDDVHRDQQATKEAAGSDAGTSSSSSTTQDQTTSTSSSATDKDNTTTKSAEEVLNRMNVNPYAKHTPQGPPKLIFDYEEGYQDMSGSGPSFKNREERIIHDLHTRRTIRIKKNQQVLHQQYYSSTKEKQIKSVYAQYQRFVDNDDETRVNPTFIPGGGYKKQPSSASSSTDKNSNDCVIL